jgi:hypothetical protein
MTSPKTIRTMNLGPPLPDFDTLAALHRDDPDAFEHFRRKLLKEALDSAPPVHQPALQELLGSIERTREASATPMDAVIAASRAMQDSAARMVKAWGQARVLAAGWQTALVIERMRK